jgi:hypothetical protein
VGLYRPSVEYSFVMTKAPATLSPRSIVEYEIELRSTGADPTNLLVPTIWVQGPPGTALLSTACVSMDIGSYPLESVFPASAESGRRCPTTGVVPINQSLTSHYLYNATALAGGTYLSNLPGTLDAPGGGRMRFNVRVRAGNVPCTSGNYIGRPYVFVSGYVRGLPALSQSNAFAESEIVGDCKQADIQALTSASTPTLDLDPSGEATWTQSVTISNLSSGPAAATATDVEFGFERRQTSVIESRGPLLCESTPAGLCPSAEALAAAVVMDTPSAFLALGTVSAIPPLGTLTLSQRVTATRNGCTTSTGPEAIKAYGDARPSRSVSDPNYEETYYRQSELSLGPGPYWGNNGQQIAVEVEGLRPCPEGQSTPPALISVVTTGPFPSASAAENDAPLYPESTGSSFVPELTKTWFKILVANPSDASLPIGSLTDVVSNYSTLADRAPSGFLAGGATLADWGISCKPSGGIASCHQLAASAGGVSARTLTLRYDPSTHGGRGMAELGPKASLTYIVPFTTPTPQPCLRLAAGAINTASLEYADPTFGLISAAGSAPFNVANTACFTGGSAIHTQIVKAADSGQYGTIALDGSLTYEVTLFNNSDALPLDVPHLTSSVGATGATLSTASISCAVASGAAKCPARLVVSGVRSTANGAQFALPQPSDIDLEWGAIGANTMPPRSSLRFTITLRLSDPQPGFNGVRVDATLSAEHDRYVWPAKSASDSTFVPGAPQITIRKSASLVTVGTETFVDYQVMLANLSSFVAYNAVFRDPLAPNLVASNVQGYSNVSCMDISSEAFVPAPRGNVACPPITSDARGLQAVIATFGTNSALLITYRARLPLDGGTFANEASVLVPVAGVPSFGSGFSHAQQSLQRSPSRPTVESVPVPAIDARQLLVLAVCVVLFGLRACRRA